MCCFEWTCSNNSHFFNSFPFLCLPDCKIALIWLSFAFHFEEKVKLVEVVCTHFLDFILKEKSICFGFVSWFERKTNIDFWSWKGTLVSVFPTLKRKQTLVFSLGRKEHFSVHYFEKKRTFFCALFRERKDCFCFCFLAFVK